MFLKTHSVLGEWFFVV